MKSSRQAWSALRASSQEWATPPTPAWVRSRTTRPPSVGLHGEEREHVLLVARRDPDQAAVFGGRHDAASRSGRPRCSPPARSAGWARLRAFDILGALTSLDSLISLADSALFLLSVFNIIGLYLLASVVKRELGSCLEFVRARYAGESSDDGEDEESVNTTA
ncbi:hypothetical protein ACWD3K_34025 [Streptomyces sp. NPDC002778]